MMRVVLVPPDRALAQALLHRVISVEPAAKLRIATVEPRDFIVPEPVRGDFPLFFETDLRIMAGDIVLKRGEQARRESPDVPVFSEQLHNESRFGGNIDVGMRSE